MSKKSTIDIEVELDVNHVPHKIRWTASDLEADKKAKAMMLSMWDEQELNTLSMNLWTKEMTVEEMSKFYFQAYLSMAENFEKSTSEDQMALAMREFAEFFGEKMGVIKSTGKFDK